MAFLRLVTSCTRGKSIDFNVSRMKKVVNFRDMAQKVFNRESAKDSQKLQWLLASTGVVFTKLAIDFNTAKCEIRASNVNVVTVASVHDKELENQSDVPFPWIQFLKYLLPHVGFCQIEEFISQFHKS